MYKTIQINAENKHKTNCPKLVFGGPPFGVQLLLNEKIPVGSSHNIAANDIIIKTNGLHILSRL